VAFLFIGSAIAGLGDRGETPGALPEIEGDRHWLDVVPVPPGGLITMVMDLTVVDPAERNRKFIADLAAERSWLGKTQVVRLARLSATHDTGLRCDELQVHFIAVAARACHDSTIRQVCADGQFGRHALPLSRVDRGGG
jgi:hypothetical protein